MVKRFGLTLFFYSGIFFLTILFVLMGLPGSIVLVVTKRYSLAEALRFAIWMYGKAWTKLLAVIVPLTVIGVTKELPSTCIIVPNHQSVFDPYCMGAWIHHNVVFVVNNWPFSIPIYGPCMRRAGYLNKEKMDGETLLARAQKLLKQGVSVLIFPEGTRSRNGELQRFHSGAFKLAVEAGVPIVPLCIQGLGIFLPKGEWLIQPAPVRITALNPVYPGKLPSLQAPGTAPATTMRRLIKKQLQKKLEQG